MHSVELEVYPVHRAVHLLRLKVRIHLRHAARRVPKKLLNFVEGNAILNEPRCKGVAQNCPLTERKSSDVGER